MNLHLLNLTQRPEAESFFNTLSCLDVLHVNIQLSECHPDYLQHVVPSRKGCLCNIDIYQGRLESKTEEVELVQASRGVDHKEFLNLCVEGPVETQISNPVLSIFFPGLVSCIGLQSLV